MLKIISQECKSDIVCRDLETLVLFSLLPYIELPRIISDFLIAIWIGTQPKEKLQCSTPTIISDPSYWFFYIFYIAKID
jgi:hypothetical protein